MLFTGMSAFENLKSKSSNLADFVPDRKLADLFKTSCNLAENLRSMSVQERKQMLGLDLSFLENSPTVDKKNRRPSPKKIRKSPEKFGPNLYPMIGLVSNLSEILATQMISNPCPGETFDYETTDDRVRLGNLVTFFG